MRGRDRGLIEAHSARTAATLVLAILAAACSKPEAPAPAVALPPKPPMAAARPHEVPSPNGSRTDEYYWLRDDERKNEEMLAYLAAENAHADAVLAPSKAAQETLYAEIVGRIKQDDSTVPALDRGAWYYSRFEEGKQHPIHARRVGTREAPEEILVDGNARAEGRPYWGFGGYDVSFDGTMLAFLEDTVGRSQFTLRFKDLRSGAMLTDEITGLSSSAAWTQDGKSILYVENDPVTLLSKRVKRHVLGTNPSQDTVIYEEPDETFYLSAGRTTSDEYFMITSSATLSSETRVAPVSDPTRWTIVSPREANHEYDVDHAGGRFVIRTNWEARNFRVMQVAPGALGDKLRWKEVIAHSDDVLISRVAPFDDWLAIGERSGGLQRVRYRSWDGTTDAFVEADETAYVASLSSNDEPSLSTLRTTYSSMRTPDSVYEVDMKTGARTLLKREPVLGGFDSANYVTERLWAPARDGVTKIPVTLLYRKGFEKNGTAPLHQYGYGSYGSSSDPWFRSTRLSLVDRGIVSAIAHVRGGQEMGRAWYDDGRMFAKMNTFTDFIDVTDYLVAEGWCAKDKVIIEGGSAGGLLMGAVANMAPGKYRLVVSHVPFVDVVTTMLDETIPLTTNEFDEWGNPKNADSYAYMLSYSPYDNVTAQAYPAMFVSTGLWDSQVQYYEPAKWVARLRSRRTDTNPLVFRVNMEAGHGGKSGRFRRFQELAEQQAFMFQTLGVEVEPLPVVTAPPAGADGLK